LATPRARKDGTDVRFEAGDVPPWLPLWLAAGLAGFIIIVLLGITIGFPLADHQQFRGPLQVLPPGPRLQVAPGDDLARYQAAKQKEVQSSIDAAMNATAAQGWGPPR
jgi:hypothetical protein